MSSPQPGTGIEEERVCPVDNPEAVKKVYGTFKGTEWLPSGSAGEWEQHGEPSILGQPLWACSGRRQMGMKTLP